MFDAIDPVALGETLFLHLQAAPAPVFFAVMAIACLLPIPVTPFYLAAGSLFDTQTALAGSGLAVAANIALMQGGIRSFLRPHLVRFVASRDRRVPTFEGPSEELQLIFLVRCLAGLPLCLENLVLGLAGVRLSRSLLVSVPVHLAFASSFILLGRSIFEGNLRLAVGAVVLALAIAFATRLVRSRGGLRPDAG